MFATLTETTIGGETRLVVSALSPDASEGAIECGESVELGDVYSGGGFLHRAGVDRAAEAVVDEEAEAEAQMMTALSERRTRAETEFTFNGAPLRLDEGTQARIGSAIQYLELSGAESVRWQISRGVFATLTLPQLRALGVAAGAHVQACFVNVETLALEIMGAEGAAAKRAVDLEQGWPV